MIELIRCPTCANCLGEYYVCYMEMKKILKEKIENETGRKLNDNYVFEGKDSFKEILDILKLDRYCCRMHMIGSATP